MKKTTHLSALIAMLLVLAACGNPANVRPTATSEWAPTATAVPATQVPTPVPATATSAPTNTPAPTATALPTATPVPTTTPVPTGTPDYVRQIAYTGPNAKKNKDGEVIGGGMPIINYSPTMVTGKPCPRVTKWNINVVKLTESLSYASADNPCVVQNAIDDYAEIAWALPYHADYEVLNRMSKVYRTDPRMKDSIAESWIKLEVDSGKNKTSYEYYTCTDGRVALINPYPKSRLDSRAGILLTVEMLLINEGFKTQDCKSVSYETGKVKRTVLNGQEVWAKGGVTVLKLQLLWSKESQRWQFSGYDGLGNVTLELAREIYGAGNLK